MPIEERGGESWDAASMGRELTAGSCGGFSLDGAGEGGSKPCTIAPDRKVVGSGRETETEEGRLLGFHNLLGLVRTINRDNQRGKRKRMEKGKNYELLVGERGPTRLLLSRWSSIYFGERACAHGFH